MLSYGAFFAESQTLHNARVRSRRNTRKTHEKTNREKSAPRAPCALSALLINKLPYKIKNKSKPARFRRIAPGSCKPSFALLRAPGDLKLQPLHLGPFPCKTSKSEPNPCRFRKVMIETNLLHFLIWNLIKNTNNNNLYKFQRIFEKIHIFSFLQHEKMPFRFFWFRPGALKKNHIRA